MTVSINQPAYLPWLGYFERIASSDVHIVLDHVQFEKNSFTNRNKVRTKESATWLTIPVATKGRFGNLAISELQFAPGELWQKKHWATLKMNYSRALFFKRYAPAYEELYARKWTSFSAMLRAFLHQHLQDLEICTPLRFSSEMQVSGTKSGLILNLCREVKADCYLSGSLGRDYLDTGSFAQSGIDVIYQNYVHPIYTQTWPEFVPCLCVLDLLFNHGPFSRDILLRGSPVP